MTSATPPSRALQLLIIATHLCPPMICVAQYGASPWWLPGATVAGVTVALTAGRVLYYPPVVFMKRTICGSSFRSKWCFSGFRSIASIIAVCSFSKL